MNDHWENPLEDDGLTLGPEEILQREIERSKALKVDRLRLRGEIEKLKSEKDDLAQKNQQLKKRLTALGTPSVTPDKSNFIPPKVLISALFLCFLGLIWFMTRS
jgi:hypothetical protein